MQGIPQGQNSQGGSQKPTLSWQSPASTPAQSAPAKQSQSTPITTPKVVQQPLQSAQEKTGTSTYVGIFVAGLIVGVLIGWGVVKERSGAASAISSASSTTEEVQGDTSSSTGGASASALTGSSLTASEEVVVESPQKAGLSVAVSKVIVSKPTWVAVYDDLNGVPGHALGATLFFPASMHGQTSGTIELLRDTIVGESYLIGQSLDDGTMKFSSTKLQKVLGSDGKPLFTTLTIN